MRFVQLCILTLLINPWHCASLAVAAPLSIGIQSSPASALVLVAEEEGFFSKHGLDVHIVEFTAGKFALQAFLADSVDAVIAGELPVLLAERKGLRVPVVAEVVTVSRNETRLVVRAEEKISSLKEYFLAKRRVVATSVGGGPEFFLHDLLAAEGLSETDVTIVSQRPEDMPVALASGSVDAIAVFEPFAQIAIDRLGKKAAAYSTNGIYRQHYVLGVSGAILRDSPSTADLVLAALRDAEQFAKRNPERVKAVLHDRTDISLSLLNKILPEYTLELHLSRELDEVWIRQSQWLDAGLKRTRSVPRHSLSEIVVPQTLKEALSKKRGE